MCEPAYSVAGGLATLGPRALEIRDLLEGRFLSWAAEIGAKPMIYPALLRTEQLSKVDYFRNFPHLAVVASRIRPERLEEGYAKSQGLLPAVPREDLTDGTFVLPSAACFNIYLHLDGQVLEQTRYVTTVATCFRNENEYNDLRRLWSFTMREIVCLGSPDDVKAHLVSFKEKIMAFAAAIDLPLTSDVASDPFFQPQSSRAVMQKLFPQKEELLYGDGLAIGSLNFHRNFFGERCDIRAADGQHVFTGCVAFGVERWIWALLDRHGDAERVVEVLGA